MPKKKAIVLVGMPGAGKSICVEYLKGKGLPSTYFGGITLDELKLRGLEVGEKNEKLVREDIRAKEGKGAYAERIASQIEAQFALGHNYVVVDGLYSWTEYKIFKERFGDDALITAIVTPRSLRHERLANRPVRPLSASEVTAREYAEIENIEKGGPIANADYFVLNTGNTQQLLKNLDEVLKSAGVNI